MMPGKKYKIVAGPTREDLLNSFAVGNEFNRYPITFTLEGDGGDDSSRISIVVNGANRGGENGESNQEFEFSGRLVERDVHLHGLYSVRRESDRGWIEFDLEAEGERSHAAATRLAPLSWTDRNKA